MRRRRHRARRLRAGARRFAVLPLLALLGAVPAQAHRLGDSYLYLQVYEETVTGRFEISLSDLNPALGLSGSELEITPGNLDQRIDFLKRYYREHVAISAGGTPLTLDFREHGLLGAGHDGYVLLPFDLGGLDGVPDRLTFDYSVLFDEDPDHRGFLLVEHNWATGTFANENRISLVFSPDDRSQELDLTSSGRLRGFLALASLGAEHALHGVDHLMFLLALLLPMVLERQEGGWRPVEGLAGALRALLSLVSALVAAHAVAMTLAALDLVRLPERLVETVIAASIALAAVHLMRPVFRGRLWWWIFGLGLFHGFGFAGALLGLGVVEDRPGLSLLAFGLGVEAGQLVVVVLLVPLLLLLRGIALYRRLVLPVAAVGMLLVSAVWMVERATGIDLPLRELLPAPIQKVIP